MQSLSWVFHSGTTAQMQEAIFSKALVKQTAPRKSKLSAGTIHKK